MPDPLSPALSLETLVRLAGIGQLLLVAASPAIPQVLGWRAELAGNVRPLTRQVFWTWGAYIWMSHMAFGLLSTFGPGLLVNRTPLAGLVSAFIAAWWGARIVIQFTYFDRTAAPPGRIYKLGEVALVTLFVVLTSVYASVAFLDLRSLG
jgi:hypothetical protein